MMRVIIAIVTYNINKLYLYIGSSLAPQNLARSRYRTSSLFKIFLDVKHGIKLGKTPLVEMAYRVFI